MGRVVREEYVCDFCGKLIGEDPFLTGHLSLRKAGARGLAREFNVALHDTCSETLRRFAVPVASRPRGRGRLDHRTAGSEGGLTET
jgi:hypothetical protein